MNRWMCNVDRHIWPKQIMFGPLIETDFYEKGKGNWSRIEYIGEEENKFTSI